MTKRQPALPSTCAFCSYRWPPMKPSDVPANLVCPVCGTRIQFGRTPHLIPVEGGRPSPAPRPRRSA